ncbi:MAG: response regulator [Anaerolineae bacterium]|nr:response regulator [Anaerolineae bacterium]
MEERLGVNRGGGQGADDDVSEELVRDALAHLYDSAYLRDHPLLPLLVRRHMPDPLARTQALRTVIIEAIQELRPPPPVVARSREWRPYGILVYRYLDGASDDKIRSDLGISERQFFRDLKAGVTLLTAALRARASPPEEVEPDAFTASLEGMGLLFERLDLNRLGAESLPLLQELARSRGSSVHLACTDVPAVAVADAALSRQAIIAALSFALRRAQGDVGLEVVPCPQKQAIFLHYETAAPPPAPASSSTEDEALVRARRLMEQQGGELTLLSRDEGDELLGLYWPRFEEPPIVLVDDNPGMLRLFERYLAGHGYRVVSTAEGSEALRLARENRARLVVLDVMMRDMDGWAILQQFKADPGTQDIPVLVCSVINEPELARALGATALLKKPVGREQLLNAVAEIIGI